ncbi:MAG TPA: hypothetical protein VFE33_33275 [Thermoanaerobaculia bacterium]|nr:hypothetical protein [Thermoanaerobaculia bacterium]
MRRRRRPGRSALLLLLLLATGAVPAAAAPADPLAELRAALGRLDGHEPIRAAVEVQLFTQTKEDGKPHPEQGKGTIRVEDGPEGLRVSYPRAALERMAEEERAHRADPEKTTPTAAVLREVNANELAEVLSFAGPLATRLAHATVIDEHADGTAGRPARLLVLKVSPTLSQAERKHVKESAATLKVWLGPDGVPFAAESVVKVKAGFLLLTFSTETKERWDLARVGNRLVVTRRHQETSGAGLGQEFERRVTEVVSVEAER